MKQLVTNILLCLLILILSYFLISSFLPMDVEAMNNYEDSSAPVVMTNTWIDISKNGMEKTSYISDTCGNFSKSTYDMVIHSSPFSIFGASSSGVTADSCLPYQVFMQDSNGGKYGQGADSLQQLTPENASRSRGLGSCDNTCSGNKYFDITSRSCMLCPIGYVNDGNNQCVPLETCPRGFKYTDHSGNCNTCPSGKKFDNGINCVDICLEPYKELGADGNCKMKCPSRSEKWDANANGGMGGCLPCGIGMVDNGRNQCIALPPCPEGTMFNQQSQCVSKCESYERYNALTNQCQKICSPTQKFDKTTGMCVECPPGFQSNTEDAYTCKAIPVPEITCGPGYVLKNNLCVSICLDDKKNSPMDPTMCVPKCTPDSIYNPTNTSCTYCPYGNAVNNICPIPPPTTGTGSGTTITQTACSVWTYRNKSGQCTPYCEVNQTYENGNCKICGTGYHVNDKNQCQKNCPAWKYNSDTDNEVCLNRCLNTTDYWDTTTSKCVSCGSDYIGVDSNNTCILKTMDISVNSINYESGSTGLLNTPVSLLNLSEALYTSFKVSITFKVNSGPSFDHIDIRMDNSLIGDQSVNTIKKKLNDDGLIITDILRLTTGINYAFTLKFYDSANNEIRESVTKYIKIQTDQHRFIASTINYPLQNYSFYYEAMLSGKVTDNGHVLHPPVKDFSGNLLGKSFTGLKVLSTIGANGSNTTLTIPSTAMPSSANIDISVPSAAGASGGINYVIFYAEIGSNIDTRRQVVGNNGSVSCKTYCAGTDGHSWNNELPSSWSGATCLASGINNTDACNLGGGDLADPYDKSRRTCLCEKSSTPWGGQVVAGPVVVPVAATSGLWNFSFNSPPSFTSANFSNNVTRDSNGLVTITPPTGGWTVTLKNQTWSGGFSNQIGDESNLFHVDKAEKGGGYYTPKQDILIPVNVHENRDYVSYMRMNTNGTIYGLFLPESDNIKNSSDFIKIADASSLKNASRAYVTDNTITSNTVWYLITGGSGTSYNITPLSGGKIQYNINPPDNPTVISSSTISTKKGCYGAHTPEYVCGGWSECGYTCVGDYCAYSGDISNCKCTCSACAAFYPDLYLDSATGKCVNNDGVPSSGSPGSGTSIPKKN